MKTAAPGGRCVRGLVPRFLSSAVLYPELLVVWAFWALSLHCLHNTGCVYDTPGTWSLEMRFVVSPGTCSWSCFLSGAHRAEPHPLRFSARLLCAPRPLSLCVLAVALERSARLFTDASTHLHRSFRSSPVGRVTVGTVQSQGNSDSQAQARNVRCGRALCRSTSRAACAILWEPQGALHLQAQLWCYTLSSVASPSVVQTRV